MKKCKIFKEIWDEDEINNFIEEKNIEIIDIKYSISYHNYNTKRDALLIYEDNKSIEDLIINKYKEKIKRLKNEKEDIFNMYTELEDIVERYKIKNIELIEVIKEHQKGGMMLDVNIGELSIPEDAGQLSIEDKK